MTKQRNHPEKMLEYNRKWRQANREHYNETCRINQTKYDAKKREERKLKKIQEVEQTQTK
jgi:hypothetical protein